MVKQEETQARRGKEEMPLQIGDTVIARHGQHRSYRVVKLWCVVHPLYCVEVVFVRRDGVSCGQNIMLPHNMEDEAPIGYYRRLRPGESHTEYATTQLVQDNYVVEAR